MEAAIHGGVWLQGTLAGALMKRCRVMTVDAQVEMLLQVCSAQLHINCVAILNAKTSLSAYTRTVAGTDWAGSFAITS